MHFFYTKLANKFYFVQNMAEWHFSCRQSHNIYWINKYGRLNIAQVSALNTLKELFINEGFYINKPFYCLKFYTKSKSNDIYKYLCIKLGSQKTQLIFDCIKQFDTYFNNIWNDEKHKFNKLKSLIKKQLNTKIYKQIISDLHILYGIYDKNLLNTSVCLLISPTRNKLNIYSIGGTALKEFNYISCECSGQNIKNIDAIINTILHEYTHLISYKSSIDKIIQKFYRKNNQQIIHELIPYVLFSHILYKKKIYPHGYFAYKYLNSNIFNNTNYIYIASKKIQIKYNVYNLINKYIESCKKIDHSFIQYILSSILDYKN